MTPNPLRFETLVERHHDEIYSYLWRFLGGAGDAVLEAQDLTQEVFLRAYRAYGRLRPDSNCRAWLYKIATNCAYTAVARQRRRAARDTPLDEELDGTPGDDSPHRQAILNETLGSVRQAIAALPAKQQAAVILRHVHGLEYGDIAQALDCTVDSARANVYQATRRLRRELGEAVAATLST